MDNENCQKAPDGNHRPEKYLKYKIFWMSLRAERTVQEKSPD